MFDSNVNKGKTSQLIVRINDDKGKIIDGRMMTAKQFGYSEQIPNPGGWETIYMIVECECSQYQQIRSHKSIRGIQTRSPL